MFLLYAFIATEVTVGLEETAYTVTEGVGLVFVCVNVISGRIAGRTVNIDYQTLEDGAEGI